MVTRGLISLSLPVIKKGSRGKGLAIKQFEKYHRETIGIAIFNRDIMTLERSVIDLYPL